MTHFSPETQLVLVTLLRLLQSGSRPARGNLVSHSGLDDMLVGDALAVLSVQGLVATRELTGGAELRLTLPGLAVAVGLAGRTALRRPARPVLRVA